ncbi:MULTISPECIES: hypothetical protein [Burkholderia]|uniref:hypothetical protein n=1 Tax=Burkholderia TaxID=32008 RepID=UPI000B7A1AF9|nr:MULTISPECIES: hypothetical protein [Burkholderia]MBR7944635.1 hypothetical protein [Burkholderia cenocepacia]OXJ22673.1 hypothetical protein CFB82_39080 [Burkholderia sp. HI2714]CAG2383049.1 hypothetical protein BCCR12632_07212 [Burkholderia cenocepacia]CAG2383053.1 hypothetical protein BCCR75389_07169 [Burkholderia cenocepacia]CAG2383065.1 hypothetical protein BCCR75388_07177 [Burkholderia cenocepacia]
MTDPRDIFAKAEWILTGGQGWDSFYGAHERAIRHASAHNWFIQPESEVRLFEEIDDCRSNVAELDILMSESTRALLADIEHRTAHDFPPRAHIVSEAFELHRAGRYLASIPLMLATAEGIGWDDTGKSLFNVHRNRPEIAGWIDKNPERYHGITFLSALMESHPMAKPRPGFLNRHQVLHGRQLDYGSELFSLQAISLLGFVGWAFSDDGLISVQDVATRSKAKQ